MDVVEDVLKHYGVRGMKWGIRRKNPSGGGAPAAAHKPTAADAAATKEVISKIHKHGIGAASNADLKMLEQRIKLETKYNELFPKKKTIADHGKEIAKEILLEVGKNQAKRYLNKQVGAHVDSAPIAGLVEATGRHMKP